MNLEQRAKIVVSKKLVAINSFSTVASKAINITFILWSYQYLLKRISPDEFAILPVVMALMVFAPLFFSFFVGGIARYVVEAYAKDDFNRITQLVTSVFLPLAAMTVAFFAAGMVFSVNIDTLMNVAPALVSDAKIMMALMVFCFCVQMLATPFSVGYHVLQNYLELNLLGVSRDLLRVTLIFCLLVGVSPEVIWVVVATVIAEVLYTIIVVYRSRRMLPEVSIKLSAFDTSLMKTLLSFGVWTTLGRLGGAMYTNAATILLNLFGTPVGVTSYYIGATFYRQLNSTVQMAVQPVQTILTAMHTEGDTSRLGRVVFRGGRYSLWVALLVATPLALFSKDFIELYLGEQYAEAALVVVYFMLIFPFTMPTALVGLAAMAKAKVREFFLPAFLFQLLGLAFMIYSVTQTDLGSAGMALSLTVITIGSQLFYYWALCLKLTEREFKLFIREVLYPGLLPALVSVLAWVLLSQFVDSNSWLLLALNSLVFGIVYLATLLCLCLDSSERADIVRLMRPYLPNFAK